MSHAEYWQEAFEIAMEEAGCWHLVEQVTRDQREEIGGALEISAECRDLAFPTPPDPLMIENRTLERKLKWERELKACGTCKGRGRLIENFGPWQSDSQCHHCQGSGKIHPLGEREPA